MLDTSVAHRFDKQFAAVRGLEAIPHSERSGYDITQVQVGGFIRFRGEVYQVTGLSTYRETDENFRKKLSFVSTELTLFNVQTGETDYLEWDRDDEITAWLSLAKLRLVTIKAGGSPLDPEDLDDLCDSEAEIVVEGRTFQYDDDWAALFERSPGAKAEKVYLYEFADGDYNLTIEEWSETPGGESYEAWFSVKLPAASIEILALGGAKP